MSTRSLTWRALPLRRLSDEAVLERAFIGQDAAFAELYRRFHGLVYGFCLARLLDVQAAEDATQEVFLRVLRVQGQQVDSARAWLFTVSRNVCVDQLRAKGRRKETEPAAELESIASKQADTAEELFKREGARNVFLALRKLRPRYRSALILREMHGLSSVEIGETMGISPGAVDTLVSRARDAFGVAYSQLGEMPVDCRRAVEDIYRSLGSGVSRSEQVWLEAHLRSCSSCAAEMRHAKGPQHLKVFLPFLVAEGSAMGIFVRAMEAARVSPGVLEGAGRGAAVAAGTVLVLALALLPAGDTTSDKGLAQVRAQRDALRGSAMTRTPLQRVEAPTVFDAVQSLATDGMHVEIGRAPALRVTGADVVSVPVPDAASRAMGEEVHPISGSMPPEGSSPGSALQDEQIPLPDFTAPALQDVDPLDIRGRDEAPTPTRQDVIPQLGEDGSYGSGMGQPPN